MGDCVREQGPRRLKETLDIPDHYVSMVRKETDMVCIDINTIGQVLMVLGASWLGMCTYLEINSRRIKA